MNDWTVLHGAAEWWLRELPEASVDAVVTDPPYGIGFMGKGWDSPAGLGDMPMRRNRATNTVNTGVSRQGGRQRSTEDFAKRQARDARSYVVIEAIEEREQAVLHERYLAATKADRARADALAAAQRGDLGGVQVALARLERHAHTAGAREQAAGQCSRKLAAALDPGEHRFDQALADAIEAVTVAHEAARIAALPRQAEIERALAALRPTPAAPDQHEPADRS
jgi:hypothetical protein